jgi:hypothetical protein
MTQHLEGMPSEKTEELKFFGAEFLFLPAHKDLMRWLIDQKVANAEGVSGRFHRHKVLWRVDNPKDRASISASARFEDKKIEFRF